MVVWDGGSVTRYRRRADATGAAGRGREAGVPAVVRRYRRNRITCIEHSDACGYTEMYAAIRWWP